MTYPVRFDVRPPEEWSRAQLALRLLLLALAGILGFSLGALFLVLYLGLPAFAAIGLSKESAERYGELEGPRLAKLLRWIMAVYAYFALVVDQPPVSATANEIQLDVRPTGQPTVSSALLRILYGIPSAFVLALVAWLAALAWLMAFVIILVNKRHPRALLGFQTGVLRWMVRLLAYQASLVEQYPPFSLAEPPAAQATHVIGPA
jgi:hypothetical protein